MGQEQTRGVCGWMRTGWLAGWLASKPHDAAASPAAVLPLHTLCRRGVSTKIVDVNCGTYATFATTLDGQFQAFGLNNYGQLALPGGQWATPSFLPMPVV